MAPFSISKLLPTTVHRNVENVEKHKKVANGKCKMQNINKK